jgi:cysteine desulfurase/selenocysteine lyase
VVISVMEHHSNLIPWQQACRRAGAKLVYLRPDEHGHITSAEIAEKVGPRTKVVSCCHVSNVLGSVQNDVREHRPRGPRQMGATFVVDAAQSAPHMAIDVSELGCDLLALSAHKLMGPMGVGVLWGRPRGARLPSRRSSRVAR